MSVPLLFAFLFAAAGPAVATRVAPAPAASPDAEKLFEGMRGALLDRTYPGEIAYGVTVEGWDGKVWSGRTYDSVAFPGSGEIRAHSESREEIANPYVPKGTAFQIPFLTTHDATKDALGPPRLSPAYAFGLVPPPRPAAVTEPQASGDLPTLASVRAIAKIYLVALAGPEDVNGTGCWHLVLKPLGNPGKYRVRDVWLERATLQLVRLTTNGNFTAPQTGKGLWTVDYARAAEGSWYVVSETSAGPVDAEDRSYRQMRVRFVDVRRDLSPIGEVLLGEVNRNPIGGGTVDPLVEP